MSGAAAKDGARAREWVDEPEWLSDAAMDVEFDFDTTAPAHAIIDHARSVDVEDESALIMSATARRAMKAARAIDEQLEHEADMEQWNTQQQQQIYYRELERALEEEREARRISESARQQERKASEMLEASHKLLSTMLQTRSHSSPQTTPTGTRRDGGGSSNNTVVASPPSVRRFATTPPSTPVDEAPLPAEVVAQAVAAARALAEEASLSRRVGRLLKPVPPADALRQTAATRQATGWRLAAEAHAANRRGDSEAAAVGFEQSHAWWPASASVLSALNMRLKVGEPAVALLGYWMLLRDPTQRINATQRTMAQRKMVDANAALEIRWRQDREAALAPDDAPMLPTMPTLAASDVPPTQAAAPLAPRSGESEEAVRPSEGSATVWLLALWVVLAAWALRESLL